MTSSRGTFLEILVEDVGTGWNRFWFTPVDPAGVSALRGFTGAMACWFFLAFAFDLTVWYGPDGLLPADMVRQLSDSGERGWNGRASILNLSDQPAFLVAVQVIGLAAAVAFTVGIATRVSGVVLFLLVLSYVHRGPILMGPFESVLTFMLGYLCLTPCGARCSVDHWWRSRRELGRAREETAVASSGSVAASVGLRLMQVHVAAFYAMLGLTKLGGEVWWDGSAMWWLIAHPESRLFDWTSLHDHEFLLDFWTHSVVLFELAFGVLVWNRLARPILLPLAALHWLLLGAVTGLVSYSAMMIIASFSFWPYRGTPRS